MTLHEITTECDGILSFAANPPAIGDVPEQLAFVRDLGIFLARIAPMQADVVAFLAEAKSAAYKILQDADMNATEKRAHVDNAVRESLRVEMLLDRTRAAIEHGAEWTRTILATNRAEMRAMSTGETISENARGGFQVRRQ